jgi:putative ABC transport system permease protein
VLSAIGIAIGIASLVAVIGVPASAQAQARKDFEAWGANLVFVTPATDRQTNEQTPLPETAPAMIERVWPVKAVLTIRHLPDISVYRTDQIPETQSKGILALIAEGDPVNTLGATISDGRWFDQATSTLPTVVLGEYAATMLGAEVGHRIWIGQSWWAVIGILSDLPDFAGQLQSAAILAPLFAEERWPDLAIGEIMVSAHQGKLEDVKSVMAVTANPANPKGVEVNTPTQYGWIQDYFFQIFTILALGLGGIALLVGGIGIANTMVVAVMERRGEIGLRRALGARTGQIALQFVLEAGFIGLFGGILGLAFGAYVVFCITAMIPITFAIPWWILVAGPLMSVVVGILAGLYPSLKAARQPPTVTLRAV